jgi:ATP phosphoribosyltransferase
MERGNLSRAKQNVFDKNEHILHLTQAVPGTVNKMAECEDQRNLTHSIKYIIAFITRVEYTTEVTVTNQEFSFIRTAIMLRHRVVWQVVKELSKEHASFIFIAALKIERACFSVKLVISYQTTYSHNPRVHDVNQSANHEEINYAFNS